MFSFNYLIELSNRLMYCDPYSVINNYGSMISYYTYHYYNQIFRI